MQVAEAELGVQLQGITASSYNAALSANAASGTAARGLKANIAASLAEAYGSAAAGAASSTLGVAYDSIVRVDDSK